jgi:protein involved in polysaccharide export with SLBB domain
MRSLLCLLAAAGVLGVRPVQAVGLAPVPVHSIASDYRLGPGDKFRVAVFGVDSLGGEFEVPGTGKVSLPLIGETPVAGLTILQLQGNIETALKDGYVKDPHVSVQVLNYRPFYILGEVNKPGEYPYTDRLTVLNAVAEAGGFTYRARTRIFQRRHIDKGGEVTEPLTADSLVEPGDTIRIKERSF